MSVLQVSGDRDRWSGIGIPKPTLAVADALNRGRNAQHGLSSTAPLQIVSTFSAQRSLTTPRVPPQHQRTIEEQLYDARSEFKINTASVAMYLDRDWRDRLFTQIDSLLSVEDWEPQDNPPTGFSFSTFIRMLIFIRPTRRPGLGATGDGNLIATWSVGSDQLTIECQPKDFVRWNLSVVIDGERERAAAVTPVHRLPTVLSPYTPRRWFDYANQVSGT